MSTLGTLALRGVLATLFAAALGLGATPAAAAAPAPAAALAPVHDACVSTVATLPPVVDNIWRKWGADGSPLGCPLQRGLVQRKREVSGGVDGVVEQVAFQFGVVIEAPRLGPGGWIALYQGSSVHLDQSMYLAWGGAPGRVADADITVGWWTDQLAREPYRELAGARFAKDENAWSWINLHNNLQQGTRYSVQLKAPGTCVTAGVPAGYCYLAPPITITAQQPRACKSVPIGQVGTYWRTEMQRSMGMGCPVGVSGIDIAGYPKGTSRQDFEYGALTYRPDDDGAGAMAIIASWDDPKARHPKIMVSSRSTYRPHDVWQFQCTAHHNPTEGCDYEDDESLLKPILSIYGPLGNAGAQAGRNYVSYTFQGQACLRHTLAPSTCSGWGPPVTLQWPTPTSPAPGG
jgi:hypothetical protein